jgi:hypothetical protein
MNSNVPNEAVKLLKTKIDCFPTHSKAVNLLKNKPVNLMKAVTSLKNKPVRHFGRTSDVWIPAYAGNEQPVSGLCRSTAVSRVDRPDDVNTNVPNEAKRLLKIKGNTFPTGRKAKRHLKTKDLFL